MHCVQNVLLNCLQAYSGDMREPGHTLLSPLDADEHLLTMLATPTLLFAFCTLCNLKMLPLFLLSRLPPVYLFACAMDPLLDDSVQFARNLKRLGNTVDLIVYNAVSHGFLNFKDLAKDAGAAFTHSLTYMKQIMQRFLFLNPFYVLQQQPNDHCSEDERESSERLTVDDQQRLREAVLATQSRVAHSASDNASPSLRHGLATLAGEANATSAHIAEHSTSPNVVLCTSISSPPTAGLNSDLDEQLLNDYPCENRCSKDSLPNAALTSPLPLDKHHSFVDDVDGTASL
jgi:hypothetical protein